MQLMKHEPDDPTVNWLEEDHQAYIVMQLRREGILFRVGLEGIKLTKGQAMKAKAQGMESGEPDLLIYGYKSILLVELKRWKGVVSAKQKERHAQLASLGHNVHVIKERTPMDTWNRLIEIREREQFEW